MATLQQRSLSYRTQALIILFIVAFWHVNLWITRRSHDDRAPVITFALFWALPLLSAVLSYIVLDTRMRDRQPSDVWFWVGLVGGVVPWVSMCI